MFDNFIHTLYTLTYTVLSASFFKRDGNFLQRGRNWVVIFTMTDNVRGVIDK